MPRWLPPFAPLCFTLLTGLLFVLVTPIGEGPDEPAHLFYVEYLVSDGALPVAGPYQYELHQPPLYYRMAAAWTRLFDLELAYPFRPNPAFPHNKRGGAFLPPPAGELESAARRGVRILRLLGLVFIAATAWALWRVALLESDGDDQIAGLAAISFLLAPQLAFLGGVVSNDSLAFASCAWALYLQRRVHAGDHGFAACAAAGLVTAVAPWAKASGLVLGATLLVAGLPLIRRAAWKPLAAFWLPVAVAWTAWFTTEAGRLAAIQKSSSQMALGLWHQPSMLLDYPWFLLQLWLSYWAKLTWFQLKLPLPLYILYLPATALVAGGVLLAWKQRSSWQSSPSVFWLTALISNAVLYGAFILFVDFQHQGRLFYPSLAAAAGLASLSLAATSKKRQLSRPLLRRVGWLATALLFLAQLAAVGVVIADEGWPAFS